VGARTAAAIRETGASDEMPEFVAPGGARAFDGGAPTEPTPGEATSAVGTARRRRVPTRFWLGIGALVIGASLFLLFRSGAAVLHGEPYEWKVDGRALRVFDEGGRLLWTHRFPFALVPAQYEADRRSGSSPVIIDDIDRDGRQEVLIITLAERWQYETRLYCFDSDGTERFDHRLRRTVQYGDVSYSGPWRAAVVRVADEPRGPKSIWLSSNHQDYFPTIIEKLDPHGHTLHEFWNDGQIRLFMPATIGGRSVMLAGAINNEFRAATLVALDQNDPTGTAPALKPYYSCLNGCPKGDAVEYLMFSRSDVEDGTHPRAVVADIRVGDTGDLTLVTRRFGSSDPEPFGDIHYILDARFQPLHAQIESSFITLHDGLFTRGLLDHRCGPNDEAALWPMLRWSGRSFLPVLPAAARE
jgi:hypothetical protein